MNLKLYLMRAFYAVRGRSYDKRQRVRLRTAVGMDDPAPIAGIMATGANTDGVLGYDSRYPDQNPLFVALMQNKFKAAEELARAKPEWLAEEDPEGRTMLHRIAAKNNGDAVAFLAGRGVEIEAKDNKGLTPMMLAVRASALDAAVVLAGAGAKLDLEDPALDAALRVATVEMNTDFLKLVGKLRQDEADRDQARVTKEIAALRDGTTRDVVVKPLRLLPRGAGTS